MNEKTKISFFNRMKAYGKGGTGAPGDWRCVKNLPGLEMEKFGLLFELIKKGNSGIRLPGKKSPTSQKCRLVPIFKCLSAGTKIVVFQYTNF